MLLLAAVFIGYFLGSIPAGYLAGRIAGVDIRRVGSGNIGATNVVRTVGRGYGYAVFVFDFFKGVLAVKLSMALASSAGPLLKPDVIGIIAGFFCVIGHSFPVWLGFKGGKGVATGGGVISALMPLVALVAGLVWLFVFKISRYVSLASLAAVITMPISSGIMLRFGFLGSSPLFYFSLIIAAIVFVRHRSNLVRLARGSEPRFGKR